jgi:hypothetical protein
MTGSHHRLTLHELEYLDVLGKALGRRGATIVSAEKDGDRMIVRAAHPWGRQRTIVLRWVAPGFCETRTGSPSTPFDVAARLARGGTGVVGRRGAPRMALCACGRTREQHDDQGSHASLESIEDGQVACRSFTEAT